MMKSTNENKNLKKFFHDSFHSCVITNDCQDKDLRWHCVQINEIEYNAPNTKNKAQNSWQTLNIE